MYCVAAISKPPRLAPIPKKHSSPDTTSLGSVITIESGPEIMCFYLVSGFGGRKRSTRRGLKLEKEEVGIAGVLKKGLQGV